MSLTKAVLAQAKKRGKKLGGFRGKGITPDARAASLRSRQERSKVKERDLAPIIEKLRASGATSLRQIAAELNTKGIKALRGGKWSAFQVQRLIERVWAASRPQAALHRPSWNGCGTGKVYQEAAECGSPPRRHPALDCP